MAAVAPGTDITDFVQRYRLALRHIWNSCFWADPKLRNWDAVYSLRDLKLPLFRSIVANPLEIDLTEKIFGAHFKVVPDMTDGIGLPFIQVDIRQPSNLDAGTWIPLNGPFKPDDLSMTLVDLFDWTPLTYSDLRYYVVLIERFPNHPDKVGQHALVDVMHARVSYAEPQITS